MKWLIGIVTVATLTASSGCGFPQQDAAANAATQFVYAKSEVVNAVTASNLKTGSETFTDTVIRYAEAQEIVEQKLKIAKLHKINALKAKTLVQKTKKYVGKTWYVFSGASPLGWDCSGLTAWAYQQVGITLEHRASIQKHSGILVKNPKLGDIVAFTYKGTKSAYHVGIYLSPDKMIHAGGGRGERTSIVSISKFAGKYSKVTYTRVLPQ